jgi:hypothetical protein
VKSKIHSYFDPDPPRPSDLPLASPDLPKSSDPPGSSNPDPLWSLDPQKVQAALAKTDPQTLLAQISQPSRPQWLDVFNDWVSIDIPEAVFNQWNMQHKASADLYFEYNHETQKMMIRIPTAIHESIPANFIDQALTMKEKLSKAAKGSVVMGICRRMFLFRY